MSLTAAHLHQADMAALKLAVDQLEDALEVVPGTITNLAPNGHEYTVVTASGPFLTVSAAVENWADNFKAVFDPQPGDKLAWRCRPEIRRDHEGRYDIYSRAAVWSERKTAAVAFPDGKVVGLPEPDTMHAFPNADAWAHGTGVMAIPAFATELEAQAGSARSAPVAGFSSMGGTTTAGNVGPWDYETAVENTADLGIWGAPPSTPAQENFADAPVSVAEKRSEKSGNAKDWTPRDALITLLRDIDSGKEEIDELIICFSRKGEGTQGGFTNATASTYVALGLLSATMFSLQTGAE